MRNSFMVRHQVKSILPFFLAGGGTLKISGPFEISAGSDGT
jgi:hypothetical protein